MEVRGGDSKGCGTVMVKRHMTECRWKDKRTRGKDERTRWKDERTRWKDERTRWKDEKTRCRDEVEAPENEVEGRETMYCHFLRDIVNPSFLNFFLARGLADTVLVMKGEKLHALSSSAGHGIANRDVNQNLQKLG